VCVRVIDMRGIDLNTYRFDYDLTFCALVMHYDGTVLHTYGGRDHEDADSHLSMDSLLATLEQGLRTHAGFVPAPKPAVPPKRVEELDPMKRRLKGKAKDTCIHCHTVTEVLREVEQEAGRFEPDHIWIYPEPARIGIHVDRDDQNRITKVDPGSPAASAKLRAGDRILSLASTNIATFGDLTGALHRLPHGAIETTIKLQSNRLQAEVPLHLPARWKVGTAETFAWRPSKWRLSPAPGFGGRDLDADQKRKHGIQDKDYAFRVGYIVTWGDRAHTGRAAQKAGIRKGDIVLSVADKRDFHSQEHFHAWFRLTQKAGTTCKVEILRGTERKTLVLEVQDN
jgi:membrane-associated protease RseP (regulator of RpoE activity)